MKQENKQLKTCLIFIQQANTDSQPRRSGKYAFYCFKREGKRRNRSRSEWAWWDRSRLSVGCRLCRFQLLSLCAAAYSSSSSKWPHQGEERGFSQHALSQSNLASVCGGRLSRSGRVCLAGSAPWPRCSCWSKTVLLKCRGLFSTIRSVVWGVVCCLGGGFLGLLSMSVCLSVLSSSCYLCICLSFSLLLSSCLSLALSMYLSSYLCSSRYLSICLYISI